MIDYRNLQTEHDNLLSYSRQSISTLNDLNSFFKSLYKCGEHMYTQTKHSSNKLFSELLKNDSKSTISKQIFTIYRSHEGFLNKYKNYLNSLEFDLIEPITYFTKDLSENFSSNLCKIKQLYHVIMDKKQCLEKSKSKYFDACRSVQEKEITFLKYQDNINKLVDLNNYKNINSEEQLLSQIHESLINLKISAEESCQIYKKEIENTNIDFEKYEEKYFLYINEIKNIEEKKLLFLKGYLEKYIILQNDFTNINLDHYNRIKNSLISINIEEDLKSFEEKFINKYRFEIDSNQQQLDNISKNNNTENIIDNNLNNISNLNMLKSKRIQKEEFINYDIYKRNIQSVLSTNYNVNSDITSSNTMFSDNPVSSFINNYKSFNSLKDKFIKNNTFIKDVKIESRRLSKIKEFEDNVSKLLKLIYLKDNIDQNLKDNIYNEIKDSTVALCLNNNEQNSENTKAIYYSQIIIDTILIKAKNFTTLDFINKNNFLFFLKLIQEIFINISLNKSEYFDMFFAILYISPKTRYYDKDRLLSYYLSPLLSQNIYVKKFVLNNEFWKDLILYKLNKKNCLSQKQIETKYKEYMSNNYKFNSNITNNNNNKSTASMFLNIGNKVYKTLTNNNNSKDNTINTKNYEEKLTLDDFHKSLLSTNKNTNLNSIIKEFIPHMVYYNLGYNNSFKLISDIHSSNYEKTNKICNNEYNEKLIYYKTILQSNYFSVKLNILPDFNKAIDTSAKYNKIKNNRTYSRNNYLLKNHLIGNTLFVILNSLDYLENKYIYDILTLNKNAYIYILKYICNNALSNKTKTNNNSKHFKLDINNSTKCSIDYIESDITLEDRLKIWKSLLRTKTLKKKFNYKKLKEEIKSLNSEELSINNPALYRNYEILNLDVKRTFFKTYQNEKRTIIEEILKIILYINPTFSYCQGMNYIASFIIEINAKKNVNNLDSNLNNKSNTDNIININKKLCNNNNIIDIKKQILEIVNNSNQTLEDTYSINNNEIKIEQNNFNNSLELFDNLKNLNNIIDEEESFYLLLGLFTNTNYFELFHKDLYKLKILFNILDKAINLKLPECFYYLSLNSIPSSYYSAPWFITLFTNTLSNIIDYDNPKFILSIWDYFIIYGWESIIVSSLLLIRNFSDSIISLKYEDILNLLITDVTRAGFIQNVNYYKFINGYNSINFDSEAYSKLEDLCIIEDKLLEKKNKHNI